MGMSHEEPQQAAADAGRYVVLIDGGCGMCQATAAWVRRRDPGERFEFHALESAEGQEWLRRMGLPPALRDSMVLVESGRFFLRSTAGLRIARRLKAPWRFLYAFIVVPRPLRDAVYRLVARSRHRLSGDACRI